MDNAPTERTTTHKDWITYVYAGWCALCGAAMLVGFFGSITPLEALGAGGGGTALIIEAVHKVMR